MTAQTIAKRLHFADYLRVMLTVLVIAHHAGAAYGPTGGGWPVSSPQRTPLLRPFYGVNPMFFMGLFFLLAGYFVPAAYERKGAAAFVKGRLVRLGLPTLFFALFVFGGEVLNGFSFALTIGIIIGTYSSIGIACPIVDWWYRTADQKSKRKAA